MESQFATDDEAIREKLNQIDPLSYGHTRNYVDGAVTYLSPYISRGVISTREVLAAVLKRGYNISEIEPFVKELCWRDYFQRVAQVKDLNQDIKNPQFPITNDQIAARVVDASTGIEGIDAAIAQLYHVGYMHNHCRMYVASLVCNIARSHWHHPAQWMYYHLLDGDWASNACSWQWVAGANSSKKYYANQENINQFTHTKQRNTYLDLPYAALETMETPSRLLETQMFQLALALPDSPDLQLNAGTPTFVYNYYNLDPLWHQDEPGNRVFLMEPTFFGKYPVSPKCIDFALQLSKNIPGIQVYTGSFESLARQCSAKKIYFKEHPLNVGYTGIQEERDWIATDVSGYYPSFFAYWKQVAKQLNQ
jgi:deoxyribodipyrimidine photo-lyase